MKSRKRLRVLQISHDYEGPFRTVCRQYALAFEDHQVTTIYVCGKRDADVVSETGGDEVLFFERTSKAMRGIKIATLLKFTRLFRERRFDVVIAHRYKPVYFAGIMSRFFPISVLLGVFHEHRAFRRVARRLLVNLWCRNIVCVGVSESVSRDIEHYCGPLASRGRLFTLPHGMDIESRLPLLEADDARRRLGIREDVFCFGTVGRLVAKKDQLVLLAAFKQFLAGGREGMLVIIGAGPEETRLREYALRCGIEDRVLFTGHVAEAWRYMKAMDIFVLSSGSAEAFGMVLLEAMLAPVPIVSSDAPGPAEVVGDAAILFKVGNTDDLADKLALARDMSDEERVELAVAGRSRLERQYTQAAFRERLWSIPGLRRLTVDEG